MAIKAIETEYNGILYRSRLEARWAMFFEDMGYTFEYEPEGYILDNGLKYIPDFRIGIYSPHINKFLYFYVEVKPMKNLSKREIEKAIYLTLGGDLPLLLLQGIPSFKSYLLLMKTKKEDGTDTVAIADCLFEETYYGIYVYDNRALEYPIAFSNNIHQQNVINKVKRFRFEHPKKKRGRY